MATKTKPRKPKPSPGLTQAQAEAEAKYGPQIRGLSALIEQAGDQYKGDIETARNNAAAITAYAKAQEKPTIERYAGAQNAVKDYEANTAAALQGTGPAADIFRNAVTANQNAQRSQLQGAATRATQELTDRQTSAVAGRVAAVNQARSAYGKTLGDISAQSRALTGDAGSYVAARIGQLAEQAAADRTKIDVAEIGATQRERSAAADVTTSGPFAGMTDREITALTPAQRDAQIDIYNQGKGKDKGTKPKSNRASRSQIGGMSDKVQSALYAIRGGGYSTRHEASADLVNGQPPIKTSKGTAPGVRAFGQFVTSLANDIAFDGHISRANARRLHRLGYKVADIEGALSYSDYTRNNAANQADRPGGRP